MLDVNKSPNAPASVGEDQPSIPSKIETPDFGHLLNCAEYSDVYEPAEDSFLLVDALEAELPALRRRRPRLALEVGSGSGVVISALASALPACACFATDLNPAACRATAETARRNRVHVWAVRCDLVSALYDRLAGAVDVLLMNPPYVPTAEQEVCAEGSVAAAWAGGARGRRVTDRLLPLVPRLLSPDGVFYLLAEQANDVQDLETVMSRLGFSMDTVLKRRAGPERLSVLRFQRKPTHRDD